MRFADTCRRECCFSTFWLIPETGMNTRTSPIPPVASEVSRQFVFQFPKRSKKNVFSFFPPVFLVGDAPFPCVYTSALCVCTVHHRRRRRSSSSRSLFVFIGYCRGTQSARC